MRFTLIAMIAVFSLLALSCGKAAFNGHGATVEKPVKYSGEKPDANDDQVINDGNNDPDGGKLIDPDEELGNTPDATALKQCLSNWGMHKVEKSLLENVKIVEGSSNGPLASSEVGDLDYTDEPALILVKVSTNGPLARTILKLMNPKGMYCITSSTNGPIASLAIEKHCKAKIGSDEGSTNGPLANKTMKNTECD